MTRYQTCVFCLCGTGIDGNALVCRGGSAVVKSDKKLSITDARSIECWVKSDADGQDDQWFLNRIYAGGTATGYRFGVVRGKPRFHLPLTDWSHGLTADTPLPTDRSYGWIQLS